jgi:hypothetical protein
LCLRGFRPAENNKPEGKLEEKKGEGVKLT